MGHCKKACRQVDVHNVNTQGEELVATLEVNNVSKAGAIVVESSILRTSIHMELDTGAAVMVMSHRNFNINFPDKANLPSASDLRLSTYSGELLKHVGVIRVPVTYKEQSKELDLYVVANGGPTLFGRDWLQHISLDWPSIKSVSVAMGKVSDTCSRSVKLHDMLDKHNSVFKSDIRTVKGIEATLNLKPNATPKFCKARPLPYSLKPKVNAKLDKLVEEGVIIKVDYNEWATPTVPVIKSNNAVRICGGFKVSLNPMLEVDQYPLPRI